MSDTPEPFIAISDVVKHYGASSAPITVLRGVSLTIERGERMALLGKSGSGKSTLLNLIGGLDVPSSGEIVVAGRNLGRMTSNERAEYRLSTVGIIFQAFHLIPNRSALENVELPMMFSQVAPAARTRLAKETLEAMGMGHRIQHRPTALSGGERQRVAIARALVNKPTLILADEPTGNLDTATGEEVIRLLMNYAKSNQATFVLVTHDEELAQCCAERILHIQDGLLIS